MLTTMATAHQVHGLLALYIYTQTFALQNGCWILSCTSIRGQNCGDGGHFWDLSQQNRISTLTLLQETLLIRVSTPIVRGESLKHV